MLVDCCPREQCLGRTRLAILEIRNRTLHCGGLTIVEGLSVRGVPVVLVEPMTELALRPPEFACVPEIGAVALDDTAADPREDEHLLRACFGG